MPKPGEKTRYDCENCNTEFEVVLEPKVAEAEARGVTDAGDQIPAQKVQYCPFCGATEEFITGD